ncbi:MAG TPA: hypothetical protein VLR49_02595 [Ferruginibacter sp.]|nr:hypothetical protein [Ferruginibacter sp.]
MEKLLTNYLYEYKNCPLPSVGTLVMQPGHAQFLPGENRMLAPMPYVELTEKESSTLGLVDFIAEQKNISALEAAAFLSKFCDGLKQMQAYEELPLSTAGSFYMDENGKLHFKSVAMPASFFPEVTADRVIHPDVAHKMLVGDTHTNTTAMTEQLQAEDKIKSRWWIAAVVLALLGVAVLFIYYRQHTTGDFGNDMPAKPAPESKTYLTSDK